MPAATMDQRPFAQAKRHGLEDRLQRRHVQDGKHHDQRREHGKHEIFVLKQDYGEK